VAKTAKARTKLDNERDDALAAFDPAVRAWFRAALGEPSRVQREAWPRIANGETTLLLAPTGSGKTLAAFLAAVDRLGRAPLPPKESRLRVLYVSPLKALAVDVEKNLRVPLSGIASAAERAGRAFHRLEIAVRTGDTPSQERLRMAKTPPDILITTPESLYLLLTSRSREILSSIDTVIVDEIHQMAASKRGAHLFVSLERLCAQRGGTPLQRIGLSATQRPLDEIARLLGGFEKKGKPRPVAIVDASESRALEVAVALPPPAERPPPDVPSNEAPTRSVWPDVHALLVARIRAARSTMIFVNSRRLAERLAAALNEVAGEELALAHHGSVAREARHAIEERLKSGTLPAIVATSSLELGIDMGAVDQVIQVEAPPSVASGIQRIGRAGHHVGGVPSGILVPKHKQDLLACAAASAGMLEGDVEATAYPRNPLDVLAQQIVATVAMGISAPAPTKSAKKKRVLTDDVPRTDVAELFALVTRAAPFAELPRASFDGVLDMLSGRYPSDELANLRPRVTWDRARGILTPRVGSQRLAILNGGTIPDRGLYGVFLKAPAAERVGVAPKKNASSRRVGELDEEMVFELKEGEVFMLGASSWRADEITRDRVIVTPAAGEPGKMPFWHGDRAGRTKAFGERIGALTKKIAESTDDAAAASLRAEHRMDAAAASALVSYVDAEKRAAGTVPSNTRIVVERVPDELGDLRICVLSPFGARVHAPWAMAALASLRASRSGDIEAVWSDDGIVFRVPGGEAPPPTELLFPSPDDVEDIVTRELAGSSLFAARFREAAARALLLPRQSIGKRTPLWAQRKRAADLLAVASEFPSFPIILETYREVLKDAFDLVGLVALLRDVASRRVEVSTVDVTAPSPFAASLLFSFVGNFIYDEDAPVQERRAQALTVDHAQLRELLGEGELRKLLDPDVVREHTASLQRRARPFAHADAVHDFLRWAGDTSEAEIVARVDVEADAQKIVDVLVRDQRVVRATIAGENRLFAVEDAARYRDALSLALPAGIPAAFLEPTSAPLGTVRESKAPDAALMGLVARWARTHGPFVASDLDAHFGVGSQRVRAALDALVGAGKVRAGAFLPSPRGGAESGAVEYCDAEVLRALKQKTLARLRKAIEPVSAAAFARFSCEWQGVRAPLESKPTLGRSLQERVAPPSLDALLRAVQKLEGCPIPASVLEREVLPARVPGYEPRMLDQLLASGELVWAGIDPIGAKDGRVALYSADREALLSRDLRADAPSGPLHAKLRDHLTRRGAVFFAEIARTLGGFPNDVLAALWDLVWSGEVTNDSLEPLRALRIREERGRPRAVPLPSRWPRGSEGRWSLRRARWADVPSETERATAIARALLERYGVVLREVPAAEGLAGGFANVYDVYRAMEDQGRVRRGYFVDGRGATQFALPGAEERLRASRQSALRVDDAADGDLLVLAATDPANPYGAALPWPASSEFSRVPQRAPGALVILANGRLLAWLARGAEHVTTFVASEVGEDAHPPTDADRDAIARALVMLSARRSKSAIVATVDGAPAHESALADALAARGFLLRQGALVRMSQT
jgi:ATP-dependent Lhr-like helicase